MLAPRRLKKKRIFLVNTIENTVRTIKKVRAPKLKMSVWDWSEKSEIWRNFSIEFTWFPGVSDCRPVIASEPKSPMAAMPNKSSEPIRNCTMATMTTFF